MPHAILIEKMQKILDIHDTTITKASFIAHIQTRQALIDTQNKTERALIDDALKTAASLLSLWHEESASLADLLLLDEKILQTTLDTDDTEEFIHQMNYFYMLRYPEEKNRPTLPDFFSYEHRDRLQDASIKKWVRHQYLTLEQAIHLTPGQKNALLDHPDAFEWASQEGHVDKIFFTKKPTGMRKQLYYWQRTQEGAEPLAETDKPSDRASVQPVQFTLENLMTKPKTNPTEHTIDKNSSSDQLNKVPAVEMPQQLVPTIFRLTPQAAAFQKNTLELLTKLISNIENKAHHRWTSGQNSPKIKMLHVLKNYIEDKYYLHRECLEDPEQQAAILSTLLAVCQMNRNWDRLWKTPHSVLEFHEHFGAQKDNAIEALQLTEHQKDSLLTGSGLSDIFKSMIKKTDLNP